MDARKKMHWHYLNGYTSDMSAHSYLREANGRSEFYTKAHVYILPKELIVGNLDWEVMNEAVVNRVSMQMVQRSVVDSIMNTDIFTSEQKVELEQKLELIKPDILRTRLDAFYNEEQNDAWYAGTSVCCHYNGHQVLDYDKLLNYGLDGLIKEFKETQKTAESVDENAMMEALIITFSAIQVYIQNHADKAKEILVDSNKIETEGYSVDELTKIIKTCDIIARQKPHSFLEALQLHWFFMGFADYDSFGRFDQYMYPFYQNSIRDGISREELKKYLIYYLNKADQDGAILNMTIGGLNANGDNAVNDLTYLVLEVTRELRQKGPNLCLRITANSDEKLWEAARLGIGVGNALPALYNDDLIIPMLKRFGFLEEDANGYSLAGCSQVVIPGKSSFACDMGCYSALKCLEIALYNGYDPVTKKQIGPKTGDVTQMTSFEELLHAYYKQTDEVIRIGVSVNNGEHELRNDFLSCIRSALTNSCVERKKGIFKGGATYYAVQNEVVGLTNVANSLYALKVAVFDEKKYTMAEILGALKANYEGYEEMKEYLLSLPKFCNDIDELDALRREVGKNFFTKLASNKAPLGGIHWPGEVIFHYNVQMGRSIGATPDGRLAFKPTADSAGASQGTDMEGPTGILNSMIKLDLTTEEYPNTCSCLNMMFTRQFWVNSGDKVISLFKTYFKRGGMQLQINVTSHEDLIKAKENPEAYKSLVVRVGGYSAYFVHLAEDIQNDIISRFAHGNICL